MARLLAEEDESIGIVYDDEGFEADADHFETGVVIDDPAMAEAIVVPEDSVDPDTTDDTTNTNDSDEGFSLWWFAIGGIAITVLVGVIAYVCMSKAEANDNDSEIGMEMT